MVPVAVGFFSIFFNIFNVLILFPFVGAFERVLRRIGSKNEEDIEDYSIPKYLDKDAVRNFNKAIPAMQQETARVLQAGAVFLDMARGKKSAPSDPGEHYQAVDALSREIRSYSAHLFHEDLDRFQMDLVASMIEEVDFTGSLSESLHQIARRVKREEFSAPGAALVDEGLGLLETKLDALIAGSDHPVELPAGHSKQGDFEGIRWRVIDAGDVPAEEKGAILALLGSIERANGLAERIAEERASVDRDFAALIASL